MSGQFPQWRLIFLFTLSHSDTLFIHFYLVLSGGLLNQEFKTRISEKLSWKENGLFVLPELSGPVNVLVFDYTLILLMIQSLWLPQVTINAFPM